MSCKITGTAEIQRIDYIDSSEGDLVWVHTDPAVHVTVELLDSMTERGMAFFTGTYEIGETCPNDPTLKHAQLKPAHGFSMPASRPCMVCAERERSVGVRGGGEVCGRCAMNVPVEMLPREWRE